MAMASKRRLTSTDDIELRVVVKFCVELKLSPVKTLNKLKTPLQIVLTIQNWILTCLVSVSVQIIFYFWSFEIMVYFLRSRK